MAYLYSRFIVPMFKDFLRVRRLVLYAGCGKGGLSAIVKTVPENLNLIHCWRGSRTQHAEECKAIL
jgi:hypothetical protein